MRLQITYAGRWFFGLTALLAAVCAISSNNVIYLIESLLLASLLVSLVAAFRSAGWVAVECRRFPAICGMRSTDRLKITNRSNYSRFCLEIGEWRGGRFTPIAFVSRIPPRESVTVRSRRVFTQRGYHEWDGLAVASSYPFGLFRLIRSNLSSGKRVIWPARAVAGAEGLNDAGRLATFRAGTSVVEGEIRPMTPDDDWRSVVWTLSARGGDPVVRARGAEQVEPAVVLDLRGTKPGPELERKISEAASTFYAGHPLGQAPDVSGGGTLVLIDESGKRRIQGAALSLDQLAVVGLESKEAA